MASRVWLGDCSVQAEAEANPGALPEGSQADVRDDVCLVRPGHSYAHTGTDIWLFRDNAVAPIHESLSQAWHRQRQP